MRDLNPASRFGRHLIALADLVQKVSGLTCMLVSGLVAGTPMVVPDRGNRPEMTTMG